MSPEQTSGGPAHVFTIPAGVSFVDALAAGVRALADADREALARITVLLPTRRACRSLGEAFLRLSRGRPTLLPRMTALGDLDEEELMLVDAGEEPGPSAGGDVLEIPPAIPGLSRLLLLSRLILADRGRNATPEQAARLAAELARLLDQIDTQRISFDGLETLVPERFAAHWQTTLRFLSILTGRWPAVLADEGALDPAARRNRLLEAQADAWRRSPPSDPVVAAGSTGSIPATADLLRVISRLPRGAVVLPGLDVAADDRCWRSLGPTHPQYGIAQLLKHLQVDREAVRAWPAPGVVGTTATRACLIDAALRPAEASAPAPTPDADAQTALAGVSRVECRSPEEEAGVIALVMRRVLEEPAKTAALVTPDRALARRVAAALARWGVEIDDSAGTPIARTPPGTFVRLVARAAAERLAPVPLLALLKHPLAAGGLAPGRFRALARELERAALRGPRPGPGFRGLRTALGRRHRGLTEFLARMEAAMRPLMRAIGRKRVPLKDMVRAHVGAAEALAAAPGTEGAVRLWAGAAGATLADFVSELDTAAAATGAIAGSDYPALLDALMAGRSVRPPYGRHPRLHIWGLLEARLQHADVLILGGLNEGTWPAEPAASPWMSRPMMAAFGLPPAERRIGLAAHDFTQAFSAPAVVLTRATRVDGTPTVPSRWLLRLSNLLDGMGISDALDPVEDWIGWSTSLDDPDADEAATVPMPCPPVAARPRELSVTQIETWVRDPYSIYARHVLGLKPLHRIDADPGAADRGVIVHAALERFVTAFPDTLPEDAEARLVAIGEEVFRETLSRPGVRAFWWPRFRRIAAWFVRLERDRRRRGYGPIGAELAGRIELAGPAGPFVLTARADRIDRGRDGSLAIVDYKTGKPPSWPQVTSGLVPQLSLEAAIAAAGGFEEVAPAPVSSLVYVGLYGGHTAGEEKVLDGDIPVVTRRAIDGLSGLVAAFDRPETPYRSRPRPMFASRFGDYDHLARVKEWMAADGGGE